MGRWGWKGGTRAPEGASGWEGTDRVMPAPVYGPAPGLLFLVLAKQVCPKFPKQMLLRGEGQLNLLFTGL